MWLNNCDVRICKTSSFKRIYIGVNPCKKRSEPKDKRDSRMEFQWLWMSAATLLACYIFVNKVMWNLNGWYYDLKFKNKQYPLPPGDMGWPLVGNLWPFFKYFLSGRAEMFIDNIVLKYFSFSLSFCLCFSLLICWFNYTFESLIFSIVIS